MKPSDKSTLFNSASAIADNYLDDEEQYELFFSSDFSDGDNDIKVAPRVNITQIEPKVTVTEQVALSYECFQNDLYSLDLLASILVSTADKKSNSAPINIVNVTEEKETSQGSFEVIDRLYCEKENSGSTGPDSNFDEIFDDQGGANEQMDATSHGHRNDHTENDGKKPDEDIKDTFFDTVDLDSWGAAFEDEVEDNEPKLQTSLSGLERANQVASECRQLFNWSLQSQVSLSSLFDTKGYGKIKEVLKELVNQAGLSESEFLEIEQIRYFWKSNAYLWAFFTHLNVSKDAYPSISWAFCLKCFRTYSEGQASAIELTESFDTHYEDWYQNDSLRQDYPAFYHYLKHLVESDRHWGDRASFEDAENESHYKSDGFWVDTGCSDPFGLTSLEELQQLGIIS